MRPAPAILDSSAWLAYFTGEPNAAEFAPIIEGEIPPVVPTICLTEVVRVLARQMDQEDALQASLLMRRGTIVDLDAQIALDAAGLGLDHKLPLADSIIYATAQRVHGVLWTQDAHFDGLPDVRYFAKR